MKKNDQTGFILPSTMIFISISSIATWSMVMNYRVLQQNDPIDQQPREAKILSDTFNNAGSGNINTQNCQAQLIASTVFELSTNYLYDIKCDNEKIGMLHIIDQAHQEQLNNGSSLRWWHFFSA